MGKNVFLPSGLVLSVETSGRSGSAAIAQGPKIIESRHFTGPMRHSAELFGCVVEMLKKSSFCPEDIKQVYISAGPGSFTGIRIAVTMAKTMNFANQVQIAAVNSLDAAAANVEDYIRDKHTSIDRIGVIIDAKREQFFTAVYCHEKGGWKKTTQDCLMSAGDFVRQFGREPIWILGEGLLYYSHLFEDKNIRFIDKEYWSAKAEKIHQLGWQAALKNQFSDPLKLVPNYLRGPDATPKSAV